MFPYLSLGPYLLHLSGLVLLAGIWFAILLTEKEALKLKLPPKAVVNLASFGLIGGLIGARLVYAAKFWRAYFDDPLSLVALNFNTLSLTGGVLIGLALAIFYGRRKNLPFRKTLDTFTPGLALFLVFFAVANFLSGDAFGSPSHVPWAIYLWGENRHPSQVYDFALSGIIFIILLRWPQGKLGGGANFLVFIVFTAASRLFLEAFRGDSLLISGGVRVAQITSLIILLFCLGLVRKWVLEGSE